MLLRIGILGIIVILAITFLSVLLNLIVSIMMYVIGILVLIVLSAVIFLPSEKLEYYWDCFQSKLKQFRLKSNN